MQYLTRMPHYIVGLFLPPLCACCRAPLPLSTEGISLCSACWAKLPRWRKDDVPVPSVRLLKDVDSFSAPFLYEDPIKKLISQFKYEDTPELSKLLSMHMRGCVSTLLETNAEEDVLVLAVPMYKRRLWERQYNQSDLLAKYLAEHFDVSYCPEALLRIRSTEQQQGKTAVQRKKNLQGAFKADESKVKGKTIFLIDDVWTTGSTAVACATALKKAGAFEVHVVTLCYVNM